MSPAPRVVLLDSCSYFRLARSIHPLLAGTFGPPPPYSLFVLSDLDDEYLTSSRLKNKFEWVNAREYRDDRSAKKYKCRGKWAAEAGTSFSFLAAYARDNGFMLAPEDLKALAVGFVRHIPVVSDDRALRQVATTHGVECWETMKLLKLMVDCGRITISKVNEILEYLDNENDLPAGRAELRVQYKELFDLQCPL
jgi:hypothetical protein